MEPLDSDSSTKNHKSNMDLHLSPPSDMEGTLWRISGRGKDRDDRSTVEGVYYPATGRFAPVTTITRICYVIIQKGVCHKARGAREVPSITCVPTWCTKP